MLPNKNIYAANNCKPKTRRKAESQTDLFAIKSFLHRVCPEANTRLREVRSQNHLTAGPINESTVALGRMIFDVDVDVTGHCTTGIV